MSFDDLGLTPELLRAVADQGYTEPTPVQREAIPSSSPAATSSPAPRPAPARPPPSSCRCSSSSTPSGRPAGSPTAPRARPRPRASTIRAAPPTRRSAPSSSPRPASSRSRSRRASGPTAPTARSARRRSTAASASTPGPRPARRPRDRRRDPRPPARPHRAAARSTCRRSRSSSSTRPTGCSTWASSATSARSSRCCPRDRQNLLFSATFSDDIRRLAGGILDDPATVQVTPRNTADRARHPGRPPGRPRAQARAAQPPDPERPDRPGARLHPDQARRQPPRRAARAGTASTPTAIHGNKSQGQRVRALDDFKAGRVDDPRRDRGRRARPRHRGAAARRELRAADGPRGLRPPDRPDRPRRRRRRRDLARLRRRGAAPPRHRAAPRPARSRREVDPGLRARSARSAPSRSASGRPARGSPIRRAASARGRFRPAQRGGASAHRDRGPLVTQRRPDPPRLGVRTGPQPGSAPRRSSSGRARLGHQPRWRHPRPASALEQQRRPATGPERPASSGSGRDRHRQRQGPRSGWAGGGERRWIATATRAVAAIGRATTAADGPGGNPGQGRPQGRRGPGAASGASPASGSPARSAATDLRATGRYASRGVP